LFISHSSKDNVEALAFQRWLTAAGWSEEDVFIDLHGIGAGERWRDMLCKANAACEAVILLASPDSLESKECQREMNLAEDLGKEIIVAILRDLTKADARLARYADRQFVDLSAEPTERMEPFEYDGQLRRVHFHMPALNAIAARLSHLGIAPNSFAWQPRENEGPYPGLAAFSKDDAGIFFGREADIMTGLTRLRRLRRQRSPRLLIIQAASGAGKSSFLRAGLWPRLKRDPDFAPLAIVRPALGIIAGPDGIARRIAPWFEHYRKVKVPGEISARLRKPGAEAAIALASLFSEATFLAANVRRAAAPDARAPTPLLAIDQGEELFAPENEAESGRFLELLAAVLKEPPTDVDPYVLVTIRVDSVEPLLQRWPALGLDAPETQVLPPLAPSAYRDVIVKPAQVYSERVRRLDVEPALVDQLARDAQGADALPLLAFTLEKLFHEFGRDGNLSIARYEAMGGVGGPVDQALAQAQQKAGDRGRPEDLKRLLIPGLATWDPAANAANQAAIYTLLLAVIGGLLARIYEPQVRFFATWAMTFRGHRLTEADIARLKPGDTFAECAQAFSKDGADKKISKNCPDMVVLPAGSFKKGEKDEARVVTIARPFAVSKFAITFDQWDACVAGGGCDGYRPSDNAWGRKSRPVIYVNWLDAQNYVEWLNHMAGAKLYRLLSEAEFEYAARAVTSADAPHPDYPWGDDIGRGNANCDGCGSEWDGKQTAPVGPSSQTHSAFTICRAMSGSGSKIATKTHSVGLL